jgi:hypothetical protein
MTLTWSDFREILEKLQAPKPVAPPKKEVKPPFDWSIASARYTAQVVSESSARVEAEMRLTVLRPDDWVMIPLLAEALAPVSVTLDGVEIALNGDASGMSTIMIDKPGLYTVKTIFYVSCVQDKGVYSLSFPCPRTPVTQMTLDLPVADAEVQSPGAANIAVSPTAQGLHAEMALRSTDEIAVSWAPPALLHPKTEPAPPPPPPEEPRMSALISTLATVSECYVSCETRLRYDVLRGGADTFGFTLPKAVSLLEVTAENAAWSRREDADPQAYEIKVNHSVPDSFEALVKYEVPLDKEIASVSFPRIEALGVVRQSAYIGVIARGNVEIGAPDGIEGLAPMDASELPAALRGMAPNPILFGYKSVDVTYLLPLQVRRLQDVPVQVAVIDQASMVTSITDSGMAVTRAEYAVRNNLKQFLRVEIPDGAEVITATVGNQVVKPAREDKTPNSLLIPLLKSVETTRSLGTFPVELVYRHKVPLSSWKPGQQHIAAPAVDLLTSELYWKVLTPNVECVYWTSGDLSPIQGWRLVNAMNSAQPAFKADNPSGMPSSAAAGARQEMLARLKSPNSASSPGRQPAPPAQPAASAPAAPVNAPRPEAAITAGHSVQIGIPMEGAPRDFRRVLVPENTPVGLTLHYLPSRWIAIVYAVFGGLLRLLGISIGVIALRGIQGKQTSGKWIFLTAGGVALSVALRFTAGTPLMPVVVWTFIAVGVLLAISWVKNYAGQHGSSGQANLSPAHEE